MVYGHIYNKVYRPGVQDGFGKARMLGLLADAGPFMAS